MTKADLVSIIARKTGQQKANVAATVDAFFDVVKTSLTQGDTLYLRGFGNFKIKHRPKRHARKTSQRTKPSSSKPTIILPSSLAKSLWIR